MSRLIVSYEQAERIASARSKSYAVFCYIDPRSRLTLFGAELKSGEIITHF